MQVGNVTTPFGRRGISLALVKGQLETAECDNGLAIDKWLVFRNVCEAKESLGLQDRALAVLSALLSFFPHAELSHERSLVVFPSNTQLALRAHGIADTTLRRHLMALVEAGLIHRKDSPNGKRYAHRSRDGEIEDAFGFSLAPLLVRTEELALLAQQVSEERIRFKRAKEALTLCRRDVRKLISAAMEEGAAGDWERLENGYITIVARIPRSPTRPQIDSVLQELTTLREEVLNQLNMQLNIENSAGNARQNERHIQNSNPDSITELEPRSKKEQGERAVQKNRQIAGGLQGFPLSMILKACPQISDFAPGGSIAGWRDLMSAAVVIRTMLGVSPSAYQDACEAMGQENAATAMACILERAEHINSPGGYLRDLTRKAARGEFGLGPMLMALMRTNSVSSARRA